MAAIWKWFNENGTALGIVLALIPIIWAAIQYILIRRAEERRVRFTTFHNLIKQLVERESPNEPKHLDRQIAVIYELRNFKEYFPVTLRILKGLKSDWDSYGPPEKRKRLIEEVDLTIKHIERKV